MANQFGTFAHTRRWAADVDKTLLVRKGHVPVRDGRVCYALGGVEGAQGLEAVSFGARAKAVSADALPEDALLSALGGAVSWTAPRSLLQLVQLVPETEDEVCAVSAAASLLRWHQENAFSGVDGSRTVMAEGGSKRLRAGRSLHPRVDPVAIVLVSSADGSRCLLGRQARFPRGMFTCISGFVEHAESVESAAAREVAEETGVRCASVQLVGSQPWPIGRGGHCELMLGCTARASPEGEVIDVTARGDQPGSGELEEARWFTRAEVRAMLEASLRPPPGPSAQAATAHHDGAAAAAEAEAEPAPPLRTPPPYAIAHHLVRRWAQEADAKL